MLTSSVSKLPITSVLMMVWNQCIFDTHFITCTYRYESVSLSSSCPNFSVMFFVDSTIFHSSHTRCNFMPCGGSLLTFPCPWAQARLWVEMWLSFNQFWLLFNSLQLGRSWGYDGFLAILSMCWGDDYLNQAYWLKSLGSTGS